MIGIGLLYNEQVKTILGTNTPIWLIFLKEAYYFLILDKPCTSYGCWTVWIIAWIPIIAAVLFCLRWSLDQILGITDALKGLGFPMLLSSDAREILRKRGVISRAIKSDISVINKAENWNDQYFAELEAEVEAEGTFYANRIDRLLHRSSHGLRRIPSLIEAIEKTNEQFILLVGEPGSGKSVALRHLADRLADRAISSRDIKLPTPLYINLRELPSPPPSGPDADFIKSFVLDHARRGDSDMAVSMRNKWEEYKQKGLWFFLFDSFDEIPAVLHAPADSPVIQQHSEAIRSFLTRMGQCRAVLASREFKGPRLLPWPKFRILSLTSQRQQELIDNYSLTPIQRGLVQEHLATTGSSLHRNPMFLQLLCRYVRDNDRLPANDLDLVSQHLNTLVSREAEFVEQKYHLVPSALWAGAMRLAVAFARDSALGLAPTRDQIRDSLVGSGFDVSDLNNLLLSLAYVKVGRTDVKEARPGETRFAFAHRRYQETLFVQYLIAHPEDMSLSTLLSDSRWREYAVALLQTASIEAIHPILKEAERLLMDSARTAKRVPVLPQYGADLYYYDWTDDPVFPLAMLIQEGLAHRLADVPDSLRNALEDALGQRWDDGDAYDRGIVLQAGGLLPFNRLEKCLWQAITDGPTTFEDAAFEKTPFLSDMLPYVRRWTLDQLSKRILFAKDRIGVHRLDALARRMPESTGSVHVVKRAVSWRRHWAYNISFLILKRKLKSSTIGSFSSYYFLHFLYYIQMLIFTVLFSLGINISLRFWLMRTSISTTFIELFLSNINKGVLNILSLLAVIQGIYIQALIVARTYNKPIKLISLIWTKSHPITTLLKRFLLFAIIVVLILVFSITLIKYGIPWVGNMLFMNKTVIIFLSCVTVVGILTLTEINIIKSRRQLRQTTTENLPAVILSQTQPSLLNKWLKQEASRLLPSPGHARSLSRFLLAYSSDRNQEEEFASTQEFLLAMLRQDLFDNERP